MLRKIVFTVVVVWGICLSAVVPVFATAPGKHHIRVNLPEYALYHYIDDSLVEVYPISIGAKTTPTPVTGETKRFEIYIKVVNPAWKSPITGVVMPSGPTNPLGSRWLGLMTIDRVRLTGGETWVAVARRYGVTTGTILRANGLSASTPIVHDMAVEIPRVQGYGIHGTIAPLSIGTSVSLGCMRMHNSDVERLYAALPDGVRIPVQIDYEPVVERIDEVTGKAYLEVFYDVYGRMPDWSQYLADRSRAVGVEPPVWFTDFTRRPFAGSFNLSSQPMIKNNGVLLAIGTMDAEGQLYIPLTVAHNLITGPGGIGEIQTIESNGLSYVLADAISEITGRSYYYDQMLNTLSFSVTSLFYEGQFVGYNRLFLHPEMGPMMSFKQLSALVGEERVNSLAGVKLGTQYYFDVEQLQLLNLTADWQHNSGVLALFE